MSLPSLIVMPGDGAPSPYTIPGTHRTYACAPGSAIVVPGEDAAILRGQHWVGAGPGSIIKHVGPTSGRPTTPEFVGELYLDTTLNALVVYGGAKSLWLNACTGVAA